MSPTQSKADRPSMDTAARPRVIDQLATGLLHEGPKFRNRQRLRGLLARLMRSRRSSSSAIDSSSPLRTWPCLNQEDNPLTHSRVLNPFVIRPSTNYI